MKTMNLRRLQKAALCSGMLGLALTLWSGPDFAHERDAAALQLKVLSNRADLISGGDALVDVALLNGAKAADIRMTVSVQGQPDRDVTSQFALRANSRFQGLLTGLVNGNNLLTAKLVGNGSGAQITITNYPNGGPIFSGPQIQPCSTSRGIGRKFQALAIGQAQNFDFRHFNNPAQVSRMRRATSLLVSCGQLSTPLAETR